ncbi:hypothetical protein [Lelliottia wanjuensis]|uniref:Uncharacterized protein n=1 Tax=Lelliottia wanjuensis TaxID=3050585 RepID=A0AAP4LDK5_9ENTR|nr:MULTISPECIES: hypothetical protein [unclassified Lelliottia]MDK9366437.1 hypothetical protein [Lelliottia sp. V106_12]MDK9618694.1 hypothetical protein [Lelliottia sp. V106_9]
MEALLSEKESKVTYHYITDIFKGDAELFKYSLGESKIGEATPASLVK